MAKRSDPGIAIGTPLIPGTVELGADVLYIGCGHEEPCPGLERPCSVHMYGPMELMQVLTSGLLCCRPEDLEDPRHWPLFEPHELSTPEAVAKHAAAALEDEAA